MSTKPYVCHCGKSNIKLWREYNSTVVAKVQCMEHFSTDKQLRIHFDKEEDVGCWVPAIPVDKTNDCGAGFYDSSSVPADKLAWWRSLPAKH